MRRFASVFLYVSIATLVLATIVKKSDLVVFAFAQGAPTLTESQADLIPGWIVPTPTPVTISEFDNVGKPALLGGAEPQRAPLVAASAARSAQSTVPAAQAIEIWYGDSQHFGHHGNPQEWVNILGSVTEPNTVASLTYSLNQRAPVSLRMGPDFLRLADPGDFNIELSTALLVSGVNEVVITATITGSNSIPVTKSVEVIYEAGKTWPLPYTADWSSATTIQDVGQVVDGHWQLEGDTVRPLTFDYDRLIGMGDNSWHDYEATVPVTIRGIDKSGFNTASNGAGIGLLVRWRGHFQLGNEQPRIGWQQLGGLGWYRWAPNGTEGAQMLGYGGGWIDVNSDKVLDFNTPYYFKVSVQSIPDQPAYYRFKFWKQSDLEPLTWDVEGPGTDKENEPDSGSLLLVAHHVDASFGDVVVEPISSIPTKLTLAPTTNGTITADPDLPAYTYGQKVTLTAKPAVGYKLETWSGDLLDTASTVTVFMTKDVAVGATFVEAPVPVISVTASISGVVTITPQKDEYIYGEEVTFTALPDDGYMLTKWGGNVDGNANPLRVTINGDININPRFAVPQAPFSDDFNRCVAAEDRWQFGDPLGDSSYSVDGQQLTITTPAGTDHDLWEGKNLAARLMQQAADRDMDLVVKFSSIPSERYQMQGMIIQQDAANFIRADFFTDGIALYVFSATVNNGVAEEKLTKQISASGPNLYLRMTRVNDQWTQSYSFDGVNWETSGTFVFPLLVQSTGIFAGTAIGAAAPANTVVVDYFSDTGTPFTAEDGKPTAPIVTIIGQGTVKVNPQKSAYSCNEEVTLTAEPEDGWRFGQWGGATTGMAATVSFNYNLGDAVTATFVEEPKGTETPEPTTPTIFLPIVVGP